MLLYRIIKMLADATKKFPFSPIGCGVYTASQKLILTKATDKSPFYISLMHTLYIAATFG